MPHKFLPGLLENIFVNAPLGIFSTNLDRVVTSANKLAAELHGFKENKSLLGKAFPDFIPHSAPVLKKLEKVLNKSIDKATIEYQLNNKQDTKTIKMVSTLLRDKNYKPIGLLNMCEDITLEKNLANQVKNYTQKLEEKVLSKTQELEKTNLKLINSEKLRVLGNLIASVAHEISNPLCSMEYILFDAKENSSEQHTQKSVDLCLGEITRITNLLSKLREHYRPSDDEKSPADINQLIEDILQINRVYLLHKKIQLEKIFDTQLPSIAVHADQMKQVVMNIIINAVDAMPEGGNLTVRTLTKDNKVVIQIRDNGMGIPAEHQHKIFNSFFTTKLGSNGLGLGLSVSAQIIKNHGGEIWVENEDRGSTFIISLPLKTGEKQELQLVHVASKEASYINPALIGGMEVVRQEEEVTRFGRRG